MEEVQTAIAEVCDEVKNLLLEKNKAYGNSAMEPIKCFAKMDSLAQIRVRIDDKLKRIQNGGEYPGDDTVLDLIGYLILYRVGLRMQAPEPAVIVSVPTEEEIEALDGGAEAERVLRHLDAIAKQNGISTAEAIENVRANLRRTQ